jgi:hypothetical protein
MNSIVKNSLSPIREHLRSLFLAELELVRNAIHDVYDTLFTTGCKSQER